MSIATLHSFWSHVPTIPDFTIQAGLGLVLQALVQEILALNIGQNVGYLD
jgi:hypothetical protein